MSAFWAAFYRNAPLATLLFWLVVAAGLSSYQSMPRARDPEINFNWVNIWTPYPGASAERVAREVTEPLEEALRTVSDIRYVVSTSREGLSSILVRFEELDARTFDKRVADVRREVSNRASSFPDRVKTPRIVEITTSNGFPTAMLALYGPAGREVLQRFAEVIKRELEQFKGIDRALVFGQQDRELAVLFDPWQLAALGLLPTRVADELRAAVRDLAAGRIELAEKELLVEVRGRSADPERLAQYPIALPGVEPPAFVALGQMAQVVLGNERPRQLARYAGHEALLISVTKKPHANTLALIEELKRFIAERNPALARVGLALELVDDPTHETRAAIELMEQNAVVGLVLVLGVASLFLGWRLAFLVALGMVFALAATFASIAALGSTLNLTVLLGIIIALGMLVDDAVVIVEAIHDKARQGLAVPQAVFAGMREVAAPVASAVLTTVAAFLPLMFISGILGDFLRIVPLVIILALLASLFEAYWLLPVHILSWKKALEQSKAWRAKLLAGLQRSYLRALAMCLRHMGLTLAFSIALMLLAAALLFGKVKVQFFAFDAVRLFYIHADLPVGTPLARSIEVAERMRQAVQAALPDAELRAAVAMAGVKFTETEPLYGEHYAQVVVSLHPRKRESRSTEEVIEALRPQLLQTAKPYEARFVLIKGGPPARRPVSVKIQSNDERARAEVLAWVRAQLEAIPGVRDIQDDQSVGRNILELRWDETKLAAYRIDLLTATRLAALLTDGEILDETYLDGSPLRVVIRTGYRPQSVEQWLYLPLALPSGQIVPLGALAEVQLIEGSGVIRRYQFVRSVTVEAEIDSERTTTHAVHRALQEAWQRVAADFPAVSLDWSSELDDIKESLAELRKAFFWSTALIYFILVAQFRRYAQPFLVLVSVPFAFAGVMFGLALTGLPLSLYAMYGMVALTGIAVNSAIVLIAAYNDRRARGIAPLYAALFAARRRVVPIVITASTTMAGLFSLATGLLGHSLLWGPVAASIVWGLGFSTLLTLFVMPILLVLPGLLKRQGRL